MKYLGVYEVEDINTAFGITLPEGSQVLNLDTNNFFRLDEDAESDESLNDVDKTPIAADYPFIKVITPTSTFDDNPLVKSMYFASKSGTYVNYGNIVVDNELVLITQENSVFTKNVISNYYFDNMPDDPSLFLNGTGAFSTPNCAATSYTEVAFTAQTDITITHNFGAKPAVQVLDSSSDVYIPYSITHNSSNEVYIDFNDGISSTGTVILTVGSSNENAYSIKSADYTFTENDKTIEVDTTGVTITLLTASGNTGFTPRIINTSGGTITVQGYGCAEYIGNSKSITLSDSEVLECQSNGNKFNII